MKKLIVIRHAKSSWSNSQLLDINRPLNNRGQRDAPLMAKLISRECEAPEIILCSSSKRTKQTVKYFSDEWGLENEKIQYMDALYHASTDQLMYHIRRIEENLESVALVGHNPGLTYLVDQLVRGNTPDNIPTSGVAILQSESDFWSSFDAAKVSLIKYFYPKSHLDIYN
ncbi:MAG: histidine phosphatase family protein [Saprospirales bacterium]|nr:MAG: histidine phosphatase family protein [Saprospirales bacterium]